MWTERKLSREGTEFMEIRAEIERKDREQR